MAHQHQNAIRAPITANQSSVPPPSASARSALRQAVKVLLSHGRQEAIQRADEQKKLMASSNVFATSETATGAPMGSRLLRVEHCAPS